MEQQQQNVVILTPGEANQDGPEWFQNCNIQRRMSIIINDPIAIFNTQQRMSIIFNVPIC